MGAEMRYLTIRGRTLDDAWQAAVDEDTYERGHDYYNGSIRTCTLKEVIEFPKDEERIRKGEALAKCRVRPVLNTNTTKSEVKNFPCKETRKWETYYYAKGQLSVDKLTKPITDLSQTECIRKAREYVEKNPHVTLEVHIGKRLVKLDTKVAEIKYKKSSTERDGEWEVVACCPS